MCVVLKHKRLFIGLWLGCRLRATARGAQEGARNRARGEDLSFRFHIISFIGFSYITKVAHSFEKATFATLYNVFNTNLILMHENRYRKIRLVQELAGKHYEPGRIDRCMAEVWRRYVYPVYPVCYETFRRWMAIDLEAEDKNVVKACSKPDKYKSLF